MRVSMSATGSVNLIRFASPQPPVCFGPLACGPKNPRRLVFRLLLVGHWLLANETTRLPGRLRYPGNFSPQRQSAETQAADAELAEVPARASTNLAAVVLARGELQFRLLTPRVVKLLLDLRVLDSFCCGCHLAFSSWLLAFSSQRISIQNLLTSELPQSGTAFPNASTGIGPARRC